MAEKETATFQEYFRGLFNSSKDAIAFSSMDGVLIDVNNSFSKLTGYSKEELLTGKTYKDITLTDFEELKGKLLETLLKTGAPQEFEKEFIRKDGSRVPILLTVFLIQGTDEKPIGFAAIIKNITERKLVEQELEETNRKYRALSNELELILDLLPNVVAFKDVNNKFIRVNKYLADSHNTTKKELEGKSLFDIYPKNQAQKYWDDDLEVINNKRPKFDYEQMWELERGPRWLSTSKVPYIDQDGEVKGVIVIATDITKRKLVEEELKKYRDHLEELVEIRTKELSVSEEKYRELFEDAPNAYFSIGTDKEIKRCNKAAERLLNYSKEELLNMTLPDLYADTKNGWEKAKGDFKKFLSGGEIYDEELQMKTKDGNHIWINLSVKPVLDANGKILESRSIIRDITKRKQFEQELVIKESAIRSSINAIAISNLKGVITYVNPSFLKFWGFSSDTEIIGKNSRDIWQSKEEADEIYEHIQNTGKWVGELSAQKKDGSIFYVQLSASMVYDMNSKPISIQAWFINITDRKKAEKEINDALEEIKRSNAELEQFAYIVSHDLQEPLRMVSGFANLLEKRYKESLDEDAHDYIDFIVDGATRMHNLINDLLTFSRIGTRGRIFKPIDMNIVLEATLNNVRISAIETNAIITNDPLPVIIADETQMVQLLQNLISNAIKFHGSVPPKIHISGETKKNKWIFAIRDNGIGIDSKDFERIFVIFQRLHRKGEYPGTGIGLAVCKKIIQRHGGKIWVESELKKGSTFYFSIPRNQNGVNTCKKVS